MNMKKRALKQVLIPAALAGLLLLLVAPSPLSAQQNSCPHVGSKAPPFGFLVRPGQRMSLGAELRKGVPVVLSFWETHCAPCKVELPILQKLAEEWGDSVSVFLIHAGEGDGEDGPAKAEAMLQSLGVDLPRAMDTYQMQVKKYCATELPVLFVVSPAGKVVHIQKGADAGLETSLRNVIASLQASASAK